MDPRRSEFGGGSAVPLVRHPGLGHEPTGVAPEADPAVERPASDAPAPRARFGELHYLDPRELWPAGERELLAWLGQHPEPLASVTGLTLRPTAAGARPPDESLVLETDAGDRVVVVVDLGESSDNALGRLMRTVAATGATASIWAAGTPRSDHLASMSWLNRTVAERSFIVQLLAVTIDESRAAPIFSPVLRPPRHDDKLSTEQPLDGAAIGRRADDWPSVTLIERGVDQPG